MTPTFLEPLHDNSGAALNFRVKPQMISNKSLKKQRF